jgi:hypothetical protein
LTQDTLHTKGSDQTLTEKLENLEEGGKVEVNCIDDTLTVQEISPQIHYEVVLEDSEGVEYSLSPHLLRDEVLVIEPSAPFADQLIAKELEVVQ